MWVHFLSSNLVICKYFPVVYLALLLDKCLVKTNHQVWGQLFTPHQVCLGMTWDVWPRQSPPTKKILIPKFDVIATSTAAAATVGIPSPPFPYASPPSTPMSSSASPPSPLLPPPLRQTETVKEIMAKVISKRSSEKYAGQNAIFAMFCFDSAKLRVSLLEEWFVKKVTACQALHGKKNTRKIPAWIWVRTMTIVYINYRI